MAHSKDIVHDVISSIVQKKYPNASGVKIHPISSDGGNYTSDIFEATVMTPEENIKMFAKVGKPTTFTKPIFRKENFVYTTLSDAYDRLQDKYGLVESQRFVFAKTYSDATEDLVLVVENLASKGYNCHDRFKIISWEYASKAVETLARYHALSFALKQYSPEEFKTAGVSLPVLKLGSEFDGVVKAALSALDGTDRDILSRLFEDSVGWNKVFELVSPRKTAVIVHGDYRPSNLMHKEVNGQIHVIPIDYQTAILGCPVADLIYFIVNATDQEFRHLYYHQLVDHYCEQLALAMKRLGLEPEETYGREEFNNDMKEKLPLGLCAAAIILQFILVPAQNAPNFSDGQFVPPKSELFVERLRGLVEDFKRWGFV